MLHSDLRAVPLKKSNINSGLSQTPAKRNQINFFYDTLILACLMVLL